MPRNKSKEYTYEIFNSLKKDKNLSEYSLLFSQKFLVSEGIKVDFDKCTNNKSIEDFVLNDRIEGVKKFKVNATPTIIINDKKFEKALNFKNLKKALEKLI